jgi:valyl-tRNA synthetase
MDEPRARAVREAFFQLFKAGLIYRGKRLVNWDPATQTALADDEVEMEEIDGFFYYLKYPLEDGSGHVTVATTRPETMLGDTAVGINPRDPRAAALRGKKVRLPIVNRIVPIIEDDYVVMADPKSEDPKAKFATGFLKVTPAHDPNDYEIGLRHNLPMVNVLAPDGTISDQHGWTDVGGAEEFLGLDRYEAREAVVEWFRRNGLLEDVKPYRHSVGHSYRSHVAIEPYLSDQWYMKVTDDRLRGAALRVLSSSTSDDATDEGTDSEGGMGVSPMHTRPQPQAHGRDAHATRKQSVSSYFSSSDHPPLPISLTKRHGVMSVDSSLSPLRWIATSI